MRETVPRRVGSSGAVLATSGLLWLLLPTGWPTLIWLVILGSALADDSAEPEFTPLAVVLLALPAVALSWLWWRYAGVSARPLPDGMRVRGVWRSWRVDWKQLVDVEATEFASYGRGFDYAWTVVTFRTDDGERSVRVSRSFRSGTTGRDTILSWLPRRHRLHRTPAARRRPVEASGLPVVETLRLPRSARLTYAIVLVVVLALWVLGAIRFGLELDGGGRTAVIAVFGLLAVMQLYLLVRLPAMRVELTPTELVDYGFYGRRSYPAAEIQDFTLATSGINRSVRVVLNGRGTRQLALSGSGTYPDDVVAKLRGWLAGDR